MEEYCSIVISCIHDIYQNTYTLYKKNDSKKFSINVNICDLTNLHCWYIPTYVRLYYKHKLYK